MQIIVTIFLIVRCIQGGEQRAVQEPYKVQKYPVNWNAELKFDLAVQIQVLLVKKQELIT